MRLGKPAGRICVIGLTLTAATALGATPALAASPSALATVSATKSVGGPTGTVGRATARCPRGTRVISGGYDSTHNSSALLPFASVRSGPRSWRVSAYKVGNGSRRVRLTAYAKCREGSGHLAVSTERVTVPAPPGHIALRSARPRCPGDRFALAGGFRISVNGRFSPGPPVAIVLGSRAEGRSWAVTAARLAPTGESKMTAYAYCAARRPLKRGISAIFPAGNRPRRLTALCPYGTSAASGGFLAHFPMGAARGVMLPITSRPAGGRRWTSTGLPQNANSFFSVYAYCL